MKYKEVLEKDIPKQKLCKKCGHNHISFVGDLGSNHDESGFRRIHPCELCDCEDFK